MTTSTESAAPRRNEIVCLSRASNPYLRLLYDHLDELGVSAAPTPRRLSLGWLYRSRSRVRFLHFHWPEGQYRFERGPSALRSLASWAKLGLFMGRLATARLLGYRLVWTIHQVRPHETTSARLDLMAARLLARSAHLLLVHDEATLQTARRELGRTANRAQIVAHGSYVGVYPPGRSRGHARAELGLPAGAFVFLVFGQVRPYKDIELVLEAFSAADLPDAALLVAGPTRHPQLAAVIEAAAAADPRITPVLEFVPDERVAEFFAASDAAVVARGRRRHLGLADPRSVARRPRRLRRDAHLSRSDRRGCRRLALPAGRGGVAACGARTGGARPAGEAPRQDRPRRRARAPLVRYSPGARAPARAEP